MNNTTTPSLLKPIAKMLQRSHMTIFIVLLTALLGYSVMSFNTLLNESATDTTYTSPIETGTIDQATLDRIKSLHTSDEVVTPIVQPQGRINPFSE